MLHSVFESSQLFLPTVNQLKFGLIHFSLSKFALNRTSLYHPTGVGPSIYVLHFNIVFPSRSWGKSSLFSTTHSIFITIFWATLWPDIPLRSPGNCGNFNLGLPSYSHRFLNTLWVGTSSVHKLIFHWAVHEQLKPVKKATCYIFKHYSTV